MDKKKNIISKKILLTTLALLMSANSVYAESKRCSGTMTSPTMDQCADIIYEGGCSTQKVKSLAQSSKKVNEECARFALKNSPTNAFDKAINKFEEEFVKLESKKDLEKLKKEVGANFFVDAIEKGSNLDYPAFSNIRGCKIFISQYKDFNYGNLGGRSMKDAYNSQDRSQFVGCINDAMNESFDKKIAKEKAEKDRLAKEEAERLAKEKAEKDRLAKEEAERLAKEKAEKEERERLAKEEADRLAREKAEKEERERLAKLGKEAPIKPKQEETKIEVKGKKEKKECTWKQMSMSDSTCKDREQEIQLGLNKFIGGGISDNTGFYLSYGYDDNKAKKYLDKIYIGKYLSEVYKFGVVAGISNTTMSPISGSETDYIGLMTGNLSIPTVTQDNTMSNQTIAGKLDFGLKTPDFAKRFIRDDSLDLELLVGISQNKFNSVQNVSSSISKNGFVTGIGNNMMLGPDGISKGTSSKYLNGTVNGVTSDVFGALKLGWKIPFEKTYFPKMKVYAQIGTENSAVSSIFKTGVEGIYVTKGGNFGMDLGLGTGYIISVKQGPGSDTTTMSNTFGININVKYIESF